MVTVSQELSPSNTAVSSGQPAKLLPCPFCGEAAELDTHRPYRHITTGLLEWGVAIRCTGCEAEMMKCDGDRYDRAEWVAVEWNRRADAGVVPADVDAAFAPSSAKPVADRGPGTPPEPPIAKAQPQPERS